ncbi:MAG: flagellar biosynthesis protein FlhA [Candidatus Marinimicrobia bacterium]|nr:flagellar biosynthesis protein FlhA [Candidatus Neomarinimicrobiota bacterium]
MSEFFLRLSKYTRLSELTIAGYVILLLILMIIPVPAMIMDFFLAMNFTGALVILFMAVYVLRPLEFAVFPGVLLLITLFRLGINISTTRMILSDGHAGAIIDAFGQFVTQGNPVVGFIIFLILIIINFVVITKGSTRVAEVAARFTLDAMPGKQMAIDADLNAGLIDDKQAQRRRSEIAQEADFYGSMDGASKFVRGDAVAGLLITAINLIGGIIVGSLQEGLLLSEAISKYSLLTIGDGLVAQIPAIIISTGTGIIITRSSGQVGNLGSEVFAQFSAQPRALFITSGAMISIGLLPGMPFFPFFIIGSLVGGAGYWSIKLQEAEELKILEAEEAEVENVVEEPPQIEDLVHPDSFEIEVGYGLISLVDEKQGGNLLNRISSVRKSLAIELGIVIPPIRIRDYVELEPNSYRFKVYGIPVDEGVVYPNRYMVLVLDEKLPFEGIETTDPTFELPAIWITEKQKEDAEVLGHTAVEAEAVITTHLLETLKKNCHRLLDRQETQKIIDKMKEEKNAVVEGLVPDQISIGVIQKVLKNLLSENIPIRNMIVILESISDNIGLSKDPDVLTEYVRTALADSIANLFRIKNQPLKVITFKPTLEDKIGQSLKNELDSRYNLGLSPDEVNLLFGNIKKEIDNMNRDGDKPIILVSPVIRRYVRRFLEPVFSQITVLSYSELPPIVPLDTVGQIDIIE